MKIAQIITLLVALAAGGLTPLANANQPQSPEVTALAVVNINTASAEILAKELKGIGKKKAQAIVDYRNQYGPYKTVAELADVKGIGKGLLQRNAKRIVLK